LAWTIPTARSTGNLITAAIWNTDVVDNLTYLFTSGGRIAQVVHTQSGAVATGTTTIPLDDTIPQNTEGTEFMTRAITPTSSTNKLIIDVVFNGAHSAGAVYVALFQDTTADAIAVSGVINSASDLDVVSFRHEMTAGTTSSTTFKVRAGSNAAGTITFNGRSSARLFGGVMASSIRIAEIRV
jgi:hypothetical protein